MKGRKTIGWETGNHGCWICTSHEAWPYPQVKRNGMRMQMARMIYEECFGAIPEEMVLRHRCNNYRCINPEHLTIGTDRENFYDRKATNTWPAGEKNGAHKLTEVQVVQIRKRYRYGLSLALAREYGVSKSLITGIAGGRFWKAA